jgi:hypothetical protein
MAIYLSEYAAPDQHGDLSPNPYAPPLANYVLAVGVPGPVFNPATVIIRLTSEASSSGTNIFVNFGQSPVSSVANAEVVLPGTQGFRTVPRGTQLRALLS